METGKEEEGNSSFGLNARGQKSDRSANLYRLYRQNQPTIAVKSSFGERLKRRETGLFARLKSSLPQAV